MWAPPLLLPPGLLDEARLTGVGGGGVQAIGLQDLRELAAFDARELIRPQQSLHAHRELGRLLVDRALQLAGTGLRYRYLNSTTVTIEADAVTSAPVAPPPATQALTQTAAVSPRAEVPIEDIENVEVIGTYSRSLEQAVDIKRESIEFSDSIVATDVADFPEQNLAEALQRMPGVAIERNKGLGSKINVRGLPSEYTHVSINDLATASGSSGREVEFDIFAAEIIQRVTVQKSPSAADEEGGIAGSVKISTARPFDYDGRRLVVSAEGAYNSIS